MGKSPKDMTPEEFDEVLGVTEKDIADLKLANASAGPPGRSRRGPLHLGLENLELPAVTYLHVPDDGPSEDTSLPGQVGDTGIVRAYRIGWRRGEQYREWAMEFNKDLLHGADDKRYPTVHLVTINTAAEFEVRLYSMPRSSVRYWLGRVDVKFPMPGVGAGRPPLRVLETLTTRQRRLQKAPDRF